MVHVLHVLHVVVEGLLSLLLIIASFHVGGESGDFFFPTIFVIFSTKLLGNCWINVFLQCKFYSTKICQFWKTLSNFSISQDLKKDHIGELLSKAKKKKKKKNFNYFIFSSCLHACFLANEDIVHHMVSCNSSSKWDD